MVNLVAKTCFLFFLISVFLMNSSSIYIHHSAFCEALTGAFTHSP